METDGKSILHYLPGGVVCDVELPPASMMSFDKALAASNPMTSSKHQEKPSRPGNAVRILVVEDSFMIIGALELTFGSFGWTMVGPATRVPKALDLVKTESFDTVLLDVNLDGEMSWDVAAALKERGIPFVLSTGYEISALLPDFLRGNKIVRKPFKVDELERAILDSIK